MSDTPLSVTGTVESVVYTKESSGYAVLRMSGQGGSAFTLVGCVPQPVAGECITAQGTWTVHQTFGRQFYASSCKRELPASANGLMIYLKSGALPGIGSVTAKALIEKFGTDILNVIENQPEKLSAVKGISNKRAADIGRAFREQNTVRRLIEFMTAYKLPPRHAVTLYKLYGADSVARLSRNPYVLSLPPFDLPFEQTDNMASELGIESDDSTRVRAAVLFELYYNLEQGHCYIPFDKLRDVSLQLLGLEDAEVSAAIDELTAEFAITREIVGGKDACYLTGIYQDEVNTARHINLLADYPPCEVRGLPKLLSEVERTLGLSLEDKQRQAVKAAAESTLMVLTGGPGTGKTTTVRAIVGLFQRMGMKIALAAPTGRAAKRMSEVCGHPASTIHRLLCVKPDFEGNGFCFEHDSDNPLPYDAVIIDETSMVDITLMSSLLDALDFGARLVLVGDADQLPAVGPGSVLEALLSCEKLDSVRLTEIFRQAADSGIVTGAHAVNRGELPDFTNKGDLFCLHRPTPDDAVETIVELVLERLPKNMGIPSRQIQVLTPTRLGAAGTRNLNEALQAALNPPSADKEQHRFGFCVFRQNDRVMQIKNNYDMIWTDDSGESGTGVFNGDIGVLTEIDTRFECAVVRFDDGRTASYPFEKFNELELAYAMTIHKSQGSEYPAVVLAHMPCARTLMNRRVLYTAMTRARDLLVMVGDKQVLHSMAANGRRVTRYSGLEYRL